MKTWQKILLFKPNPGVLISDYISNQREMEQNENDSNKRKCINLNNHDKIELNHFMPKNNSGIQYKGICSKFK